jgi:hypothetical protein
VLASTPSRWWSGDDCAASERRAKITAVAVAADATAIVVGDNDGLLMRWSVSRPNEVVANVRSMKSRGVLFILFIWRVCVCERCQSRLEHEAIPQQHLVPYDVLLCVGEGGMVESVRLADLHSFMRTYAIQLIIETICVQQMQHWLSIRQTLAPIAHNFRSH